MSRSDGEDGDAPSDRFSDAAEPAPEGEAPTPTRESPPPVGTTGRAPSRTPRSAAGALWIVATVGGLTAIAWPRAAAPWEPPSLVLDADAVAASLAALREAARGIPEDDPAYAALREVDAKRNQLEGSPQPYEDATGRRREALRRLAELARRHGDPVVDAIRAAAVLDMERARAGELSPDEARNAVGRFRERLREEYAAVSGTGADLAPAHVIRVLFMARWNAAHGMANTRGFAEVDERAYHGWLAFHGTFAAPEIRLRALAAFEAAGGAAPPAARGALLAAAGRPLEAAEAYADAYEQTGALRFRNHVLDLTERAAGGDLDTTPAGP